MNDLAAEIRTNADAISRLWKRVYETLKHRGRSKKDREVWSSACEEFHRCFPMLFFPDGPERWAAFLNGDSSEINTVITFLEVDPWFFRSGYMKQTIWDKLKKLVLTSKDERRLEAVAARYLHKRAQREFWHMARYMRTRGSEAFWEAMEALASRHTDELGLKASWLVLAKRNLPVRNLIGYEFLRVKYESGYVPKLWFSCDKR
ncbi:hypothetical protein [Dyella acidisoli]|uniref:Uncharacterized protein n=1 Tax=Dyella acidisoli TaxID=1867834 RepID=A0ABQ5XSQ3_9GAMM|nr:hypothetical protein [Dyella acidisoli]GLQ94194.1 hypothetical protein GCM10007901_31450 [Dyella acidisoli]